MSYIKKLSDWYKSKNELVKLLVAIGVGYAFHGPISKALNMIASIVS